MIFLIFGIELFSVLYMKKVAILLIVSILLVSPFIQTNVINFVPRQKAIISNHAAPEFKINGMTLPFEMKMFIDDRYAYYDYSKMTKFIGDMEDLFGLTVISADEQGITEYNYTYLSQFDFFALPNPSNDNLTLEEQEAVIKYINETLGAAIILGDRDPYGNFEVLNNISLPFGIEYLVGEVTDPTDYDYRTYYPFVHVWTNTNVAHDIIGGNAYKVKMATTSLNITDESLNGTKYEIYRLGIGDDDTEFNSTTWGDNVTYFVALMNSIGGVTIFSGGTSLLSDSYSYGYYKTDNRDFVLSVVKCAMRRDLEIIDYDIPTTNVLAGQTIYINVTVQNNDNQPIDNVHIGIEFEGAMELLNETNDVNIGTLDSGANKTLTFALLVTGTSDAYVELKTWSDTPNVVGYQVRGEFKTLGLIVEANINPDYIVLSNFNTAILTINITNPGENPNATDVNVTVSVPEGIEANNTFFNIPEIQNGTSVTLVVELNASNSTAGPKTVDISVSSDNLGTAGDSVKFIVYMKPFALFDQSHDQYYDAERLSDFVNLLSSYVEVRVNNDTFDENLLGNASIVIIPNPGAPLSEDEVNLTKKYVEDGGKLIVTGTWYKYFEPDYVNNITADFGIYYADAEVKDTDSYVEDPWYPNITTFAYHPIAADVNYVIAASSTYMTIAGDAKAVVVGNPTSYGVTSETNDPYNETLTGVNGSDIIIVAAVKLASGGKIVAFGGGSILSNYWFGNNSKLIENTIKWILGDTEKPVISLSYEEITEDGNVKGAKVTIDVTDNLAIKIVNITINGTAVFTATTLLTANFKKEITINESGKWIVSVTAIDHEGNQDTKELTIQLNITQPTNETPGGEENETTGGGGTGAGLPTELIIFGVVAVVAIIAVVIYIFRFKKEA